MLLDAGNAIDGCVDGADAGMQFSVVAAHQSSQWEGKNTYRGAESTRRLGMTEERNGRGTRGSGKGKSHDRHA